METSLRLRCVVSLQTGMQRAWYSDYFHAVKIKQICSIKGNLNVVVFYYSFYSHYWICRIAPLLLLTNFSVNNSTWDCTTLPMLEQEFVLNNLLVPEKLLILRSGTPSQLAIFWFLSKYSFGLLKKNNPKFLDIPSLPTRQQC